MLKRALNNYVIFLYLNFHMIAAAGQTDSVRTVEGFFLFSPLTEIPQEVILITCEYDTTRNFSENVKNLFSLNHPGYAVYFQCLRWTDPYLWNKVNHLKYEEFKSDIAYMSFDGVARVAYGRFQFSIPREIPSELRFDSVPKICTIFFGDTSHKLIYREAPVELTFLDEFEEIRY